MKQDARKKKKSKRAAAALVERIRIVIAGHVDHGKSSILGRLLTDCGVVSAEKIEIVKQYCERHSRPFEYAFLLDALSAERAQGVTIDAARALLRLKHREICFVDAPGHADFLRNMATGAAAADYACLAVDAQRGLESSSRTHARLLALLGVSKVILLVNKIDLVEYREEAFRRIEDEWRAIAASLDLDTVAAVPLSAMEGDNFISRSKRTSWFSGKPLVTLLESLDSPQPAAARDLRLSVQDIYKFTRRGDERRIIAGNVLAGEIRVGDEIVFSPSGKRGRVRSLESFGGTPPEKAVEGMSTGFTLEHPLYVTRGEIVSRAGESLPSVSAAFEADVFWLAEEPLGVSAEVTVLVGSTRVQAFVEAIEGRTQLEKGASALVRFTMRAAAAFDISSGAASARRFVIVQRFAISGGGLVVRAIADEQSWVRQKVRLRGEKWTHSLISTEHRSARFGQKPALVLISGPSSSDRKSLARVLEAKLFSDGRNPYFLSFGNMLYGIDADLKRESQDQREHFRRLGEVANVFLHAGFILIVSAAEVTVDEIETVKAVLDFDRVFLIWVGQEDRRIQPELSVSDSDLPRAVAEIQELLESRGIIFKA